MTRDVLDVLEKKLQKDYGEDIIVAGNHLKSGEMLSTGVLSLDLILGGGYREGTLIHAYGRPSGGKSTLALYMASEAQKAGRVAVYFDMEFALKPELLRTIPGLDIKSLKILRPSYAEDCLDIVEQYMKSGEKCFLVIDSVAWMVPKKESEAAHEQDSMGGISKLMSKALRKITGPCAKSGSNLVYLNQLRSTMDMYGPQEVAPGGKGLGYFATYVIDARASGSKKDLLVDEAGNVIGHTLILKTVKNKLFTPYRSASVNLIYGSGIDHIAEIINIGREVSLVERKGPYYGLYDKKYLGLDELRKELIGSNDLIVKMKKDIVKMFGFASDEKKA